MGYLEDVRQALLNRCPAMLYDWLPDGRQEGRYYVCADITGGRGNSLKVNLKTGRWEDYSQGHQPGTYGSDLVSLYAATKGKEYKEALHELAAMLDIKPEKLKRSDPTEWQVITPVPRSAYEVGTDGLPKLPDVPRAKGNAGYWSYVDRDGELLCFRYRMESGEVNGHGKRKKEVKPLTYCRNKHSGECAWITRDLPSPMPLYNLFDLANVQPKRVLVVEGESCASSGQRVLPNWTVTTWSGGVRRVRMADWSPLKVLPRETMVVLWPDNDHAGQEAMNDVIEMLDRPVDIVRPDQAWPAGYDIADLVEHGWDTAKIETFIAQSTHRVEPEPRKERPAVELTGKDYYEHMKALYPAIRDSESPLYESAGGIIVHIKRDIFGNQYVNPVGPSELQAWAARYLDCYGYTAHGRSPCHISDPLANALVYNCNGQLMPLVRYADHPIVTASGDIINRPGYNPVAKCYLSIPDGYDPEMPLDQAIDLIMDLLADFPFENKDADLAAAVAYPLTAILRDRIAGPVPLFKFEAPEHGTGKSLLCEVLTHIFSTRPSIYGMPSEEEETRKQITSALIRMPPVIIWDNVYKMESGYLKKALSEPEWTDRLLGRNREITIPIRTVWAATVNNPVMSRELLRRSVRVRINAHVENPEDRSGWRHDLPHYAKENRAVLLSAWVALARAGLEESTNGLPRMGRYESWVKTVGSSLAAGGFSGFLSTLAEDRKLCEDPKTAGINAFVSAWAQDFGNQTVTVKQLAELASRVDALSIRRRKDGAVSAESMGWLLSTLRGKVIEGLLIDGPYKNESGRSYRLAGDIEEQQRDFKMEASGDEF